MQGNLPVRFGERAGRIQTLPRAHGAPVPTLRTPKAGPPTHAGRPTPITALDTIDRLPYNTALVVHPLPCCFA